MSKTCIDPLIIEVWVKMADHFLDSETRHDLSTLADEERERLRLLYPAPFDFLMESALLRSERADAEERVQRALSGIAR
jgi:hypothetical protein